MSTLSSLKQSVMMALPRRDCDREIAADRHDVATSILPSRGSASSKSVRAWRSGRMKWRVKQSAEPHSRYSSPARQPKVQRPATWSLPPQCEHSRLPLAEAAGAREGTCPPATPAAGAPADSAEPSTRWLPPILVGQCLAMWPLPPHTRHSRAGQVRPRCPISLQTLQGPTLAFHPSGLAAEAPLDAAAGELAEV